MLLTKANGQASAKSRTPSVLQSQTVKATEQVCQSRKLPKPSVFAKIYRMATDAAKATCTWSRMYIPANVVNNHTQKGQGPGVDRPVQEKRVASLATVETGCEDS